MSESPSHPAEADRPDALQAFRRLVNMQAAELRDWLETEQSRSAGWMHEGEDEAVGHQPGRRILELLERGDAPQAEAEQEFLRQVVGTIRRHLAQRPEDGIAATRWRHSLMNWGHDPLKG